MLVVARVPPPDRYPILSRIKSAQILVFYTLTFDTLTFV